MKYAVVVAIVAIGLLNMKQVHAQTKSGAVRNIEIASLVMDTQTLKPVADAKIVDDKGKQLAVTNSSGYFRAMITQSEEGDIRFKFKVEKEGYSSLSQEEHWGDLNNNLHAIYYLGLKHRQSQNDPFSEMETDIADLSFESLTENFKKVNEEIALEQKIEAAKRKNENVFFEIDSNYYIVNDDGWLKLNGKEDKIRIAGGKVIAADQLNTFIKRKSIKGMTPVVSQDASFEILL